MLSDWFTRFETTLCRYRLKNRVISAIIPLSAIAVAEWCARLQELDKKNRELNGGESRYADFDLETTGLHSPDEFARGDGGITDIGASLIINNQYLGIVLQKMELKTTHQTLTSLTNLQIQEF